MIEITHLSKTNSTVGFFSSLFLSNLLRFSIRLSQNILLQRRFLGPRYTDDFLQGRDISGTTFFRADRSLGAKQEGLAIVHFCICLNTLKIPILALIQRERERTYWWCRRADLKLSSQVALTMFSCRWFHSNIILLKNEFLYCSVLHWILSKDCLLFLTEFSTMFVLT
jgi:hypothetical protein